MAQNGIDNRIVASDGSVGWEVSTGRPFFRFGWDAMSELGKRICALVNSVKPLILRAFGDNALIVALLELIDVLCPLIDDVAVPLSEGQSVADDTTRKQVLATDLRSIADKLDGGV